VPWPDGRMQAPHVNVQLFMRGLLKAAATRIYLPDQPQLVTDPVLACVPAERRHTLVATRAEGDVLHWDVHMQGPLETVFFEY